MNDSKISVRYAKALFDLATQLNILTQVYKDVLILSELSFDADFSFFLNSPIVQNSKKIEIITNVFKNRISQASFDFFVLIIQNNREQYLKLITLDFLKLYRDFMGIAQVQLTTAVLIDKDSQQNIISLLKKLLKKEIELITTVKPEIIGGFIARIDDMQIDASILTKLNDFKKELTKSINETN